LVEQLQTEMAPWTKGNNHDLEDGLIRTSIAAEGDGTNNELQNINAHGKWWFCICLFFASGIIFWICVLHSLVDVYNADKWTEGNVTWCATVLMLVSYAWLVSNTGTPHRHR
jgi:Ca2+/H+ antiporter